MVSHRQGRRKKRSFVSLIMGRVWYLFAFDLVCLLASPFLLASSGDGVASEPSGGGSSTTDVRRSPKQTIHVSAMSCEGK